MLELIELQFPDLRSDQKRALREKDFSNRKHLWRIRNTSKFFTDTFGAHARAQGDAKETGDESKASYESKMKTKMCRFSLPIQSLCKGIEEKLTLEKFRTKMMNQAAAEGSQEMVDRWMSKSIEEVRSG